MWFYSLFEPRYMLYIHESVLKIWHWQADSPLCLHCNGWRLHRPREMINLAISSQCTWRWLTAHCWLCGRRPQHSPLEKFWCFFFFLVFVAVVVWKAYRRFLHQFIHSDIPCVMFRLWWQGFFLFFSGFTLIYSSEETWICICSLKASLLNPSTELLLLYYYPSSFVIIYSQLWHH